MPVVASCSCSLELPKPKADIDGSLQLQISNIASDPFIGRLGIGRIKSGTLMRNSPIGLSAGPGCDVKKVKVSELFCFDATGRVSVDDAKVRRSPPHDNLVVAPS